MKKIVALVERDLRRVLRSRGFLVLAVVQPLAYVGLFALVFGRQIAGIEYAGQVVPYVIFVLPGLVALQTNQQFQVQLSLSSGDRRWGVLLISAIAGMRPGHYLVAQIVSRALLAGLQALIIAVLGVFLVRPEIVSTSLGVRVAFAVTAWVCSVGFWTSLGIMIGIRVMNEETRDVVWSLLNLPIMFTSSVFYDVGKAPWAISVLSRGNPLTHCANVLRASLLGKPCDTLGSVVILAGLFIIAALLCVAMVGRSSLLGRRSG